MKIRLINRVISDSFVLYMKYYGYEYFFINGISVPEDEIDS